MKFLPTIAAIGLLTAVAPANFIIGYSNFADLSNAPDVNTSGLASTITGGLKNTGVSSNTGTYGGNVNYPAGTSDGSVNLSNQPGTGTLFNTTLSLTNSSPAALGLDALVFDKSKGSVGTNANFSITYSIDNVQQGTLSSSVNSTAWSTQVFNFNSILGDKLFVPAGSVVTFVFKQAVGQGAQVRLDNIALVSIPEPGSMLALGSLIGAGAFLRTRRRSAVTA